MRVHVCGCVCAHMYVRACVCVLCFMLVDDLVQAAVDSVCWKLSRGYLCPPTVLDPVRYGLTFFALSHVAVS